MSRSRLEDHLVWQCRAVGLPVPEREYRFCPPRRFRFDLAWPERRVAVEVHGGVWIHGHHQRGQGFLDDCEKRNLATLAGWRVIEVTKPQIDSGQAVTWIEQLLRQTEAA